MLNDIHIFYTPPVDCVVHLEIIQVAFGYRYLHNLSCQSPY